MFDPISSITWGILMLAYAGRLPATSKFNFDGTTVEIKDGASNKVYDHKTDPTEGPLHVTSTTMSTSLFIKVMHIVSASGHKGPLVCVIASPLVPKDKFYVEKIVGLCNTSNLDADGWIYIANERAGTPAMWKHFFLNTFIPFIVNVLKDILFR